jgi:hypothetical protein
MSALDLRAVAEALWKTTERLSCELAAPTEDPPQWTDFEWHIAIAVVAMHGLSEVLRSRLRWKGNAIWLAFLDEQHEHSVARYHRITQLLEKIKSNADFEGLPVLMLKGAALYAEGFYLPGERPMGDIDLLVAEGQEIVVDRMLGNCGYRLTFRSRRHFVFAPVDSKVPDALRLGEHLDSPIKIEVHTRIAERLPVSETDITAFLTQDDEPGLHGYRSRAALMLHLLLHIAGNMRARALRMIQLHDVALLSLRFGAQDWEDLLAMRPNERGLWWALAPLALVDRYYPGHVPANLAVRMRPDCPRLLQARAYRQKLTDVSWSNIHIEAFPGIEWSRSLREAILFMRSRVWPSSAARLELKDAAAQIPSGGSVPWYGISHVSRIAHWIVSRPPRVQTLLSVRAALELKV